MADVLPRRRWGSRWPQAVAALVPAGFLLLIVPTLAPAQPPATKGQPAPKKDARDDIAREAPAAPDVANDDVDPSKIRRVAPVEVFKDPNAEAILDLSKLRPLSPAPFSNQDLLRVKEMAQNPNLQPDRPLIDRVVRGLAAQLTDRKSIQSLLEGPSKTLPPPPAQPGKKAPPPKKPEGDGGKAIQSATSNLLEPIFVARSLKNDAFLGAYRQALQRHLPQLLKNHLVPRVQAMIVLGEAATPTQEALTLFQNELNNKNQTLWVKLWALQGIANMKKNGARFSADIESKAARTVADFLESEPDLPWLIQLRGLEALGWLRQSGLPVEAARARMANTAMLYLAADQARFEVRAEAARALGLMQVNAVPSFNFQLVAYCAGKVAADIASELNDQYTDKPPKAENPTKAHYLAALLVGPVYECFTGVQGENNSGIILTARANANASKYIRQIFDLIKQVAQESIELINSPSKSYKSQKKVLVDRIGALRQFLASTPPESWSLVPGGRVFGQGAGANAAGAQFVAPGPSVAGLGRGR